MGMFTYGSPEGVAAVKEAMETTGHPYTMKQATWSEHGRQKFRAIVMCGRTKADRAAILAAIDGGGDPNSDKEHEFVSFTFDAETFAAMVDGLAEGGWNSVASDLLGEIAESLGVEWV